eukprot:c2511_g1_i1 orf=2-151(-)
MLDVTLGSAESEFIRPFLRVGHFFIVIVTYLRVLAPPVVVHIVISLSLSL